MAFPKKQRLKDAKSISQIFSTVRPAYEAGIALRVTAGDTEKSVFAVMVPASANIHAVQRTALRRRVVEVLRNINSSGRILPRKKIVVVVRSAPRGGAALHDAVMLLLKKSGILQK